MKRDRINGIIGIVIGLLMITGALGLPPSKVPDDIGPAVFPIIAGVMIIIPGVFLTMKKPSSDENVFMSREEWKRFGLLVLVFFLYAALLYVVGFLIATPFVTFIISKMFSRGKKAAVWQIAIYAFILTAAVYICFYKGLGLKLPRGEYFNLEL